jgi:hypothetical protein
MSSVLTDKIVVGPTNYDLFPTKCLSDKKYFGQTKPISLSDRMTDRSSDNLAQTGKVRMLVNNYFAFYPNNIGSNYYPNITNTNNTCISIFLTILLTLV